jgi:hypothetical protein
MANNLPPGAIPKLFRQRNKTGQEVGAWYCKINKKPVNLRTQDYMKARERAKDAVNGRRDFPDDRYFDDPATPNAAPIPKVDENAANDWTTDATRAAAQVVEPDAYFPPGKAPEPEVPPPTDAPKVDAETPKSNEDGNTEIPPEMLDGIIKQIAAVTVELQLHAQEYMWIRGVKINPGAVPADSDARKVPQELWERQWKKWMPTNVPIPEWAAAIALTAFMGGMVQFQGATPLPTPPPTDVPST